MDKKIVKIINDREKILSTVKNLTVLFYEIRGVI